MKNRGAAHRRRVPVAAIATDFPRVFGGGFAYNFFMADSFRLKDQPASERPRERLVARGPDALTHAELIAILLRTGLRGANVVQVGQNILQKFGSLNALALAAVDELKQIAGVGPDKAATLVAAFALARRMEQERREESPVLDNPATVVNFMREDQPVVKRGVVSGAAVEHAQAADPGRGNFAGHAGHDSGASARGVSCGDRGERSGHGARPQSSKRRPDAERGGHQGDARLDPRRAAFENRGGGSRHHRARDGGAGKDYSSCVSWAILLAAEGCSPPRPVISIGGPIFFAIMLISQSANVFFLVPWQMVR